VYFSLKNILQTKETKVKANAPQNTGGQPICYLLKINLLKKKSFTWRARLDPRRLIQLATAKHQNRYE